MRCEEAQEWITALVDGELSSSERSAIAEHLDGCAGCRLAYDRERELKKRLRSAARTIRLPEDLKTRILDRAARQRRRSGWRGLMPARPMTLTPAVGLALAFLALLPLYHRGIPERETIFQRALTTHRELAKGKLPFVKSDSAETASAYLSRAVGRDFGPMRYDFSGMGLRVLGALVQEIDGRKVLVTVYGGAAGYLTCYTFLAEEGETPRAAAVFFDPEKKMNFYVLSSGDISGVAHREGRVFCILVSDAPRQDLLSLARAKARPS
jgi:anti-sigma factor (TIGR02949 family)